MNIFIAIYIHRFEQFSPNIFSESIAFEVQTILKHKRVLHMKHLEIVYEHLVVKSIWTLFHNNDCYDQSLTKQA